MDWRRCWCVWLKTQQRWQIHRLLLSLVAAIAPVVRGLTDVDGRWLSGGDGADLGVPAGVNPAMAVCGNKDDVGVERKGRLGRERES